MRYIDETSQTIYGMIPVECVELVNPLDDDNIHESSISDDSINVLNYS